MASGKSIVVKLLRDVPIGTYVYTYVPGEFQAIAQKTSLDTYNIPALVSPECDGVKRYVNNWSIDDIRPDLHGWVLTDDEVQRLMMCLQLTGGFGDVGRD